ncbi:hypothetical protein BVX93_01115, partial [bacterium B13(2017)]
LYDIQERIHNLEQNEEIGGLLERAQNDQREFLQNHLRTLILRKQAILMNRDNVEPFQDELDLLDQQIRRYQAILNSNNFDITEIVQIYREFDPVILEEENIRSSITTQEISLENRRLLQMLDEYNTFFERYEEIASDFILANNFIDNEDFLEEEREAYVNEYMLRYLEDLQMRLLQENLDDTLPVELEEEKIEIAPELLGIVERINENGIDEIDSQIESLETAINNYYGINNLNQINRQLEQINEQLEGEEEVEDLNDLIQRRDSLLIQKSEQNRLINLTRENFIARIEEDNFESMILSFQESEYLDHSVQETEKREELRRLIIRQGFADGIEREIIDREIQIAQLELQNIREEGTEEEHRQRSQRISALENEIRRVYRLRLEKSQIESDMSNIEVDVNDSVYYQRLQTLGYLAQPGEDDPEESVHTIRENRMRALRAFYRVNGVELEEGENPVLTEEIKTEINNQLENHYQNQINILEIRIARARLSETIEGFNRQIREKETEIRNQRQQLREADNANERTRIEQRISELESEKTALERRRDTERENDEEEERQLNIYEKEQNIHQKDIEIALLGDLRVPRTWTDRVFNWMYRQYSGSDTISQENLDYLFGRDREEEELTREENRRELLMMQRRLEELRLDQLETQNPEYDHEIAEMEAIIREFQLENSVGEGSEQRSRYDIERDIERRRNQISSLESDLGDGVEYFDDYQDLRQQLNELESELRINELRINRERNNIQIHSLRRQVAGDHSIDIYPLQEQIFVLEHENDINEQTESIVTNETKINEYRRMLDEPFREYEANEILELMNELEDFLDSDLYRELREETEYTEIHRNLVRALQEQLDLPQTGEFTEDLREALLMALIVQTDESVQEDRETLEFIEDPDVIEEYIIPNAFYEWHTDEIESRIRDLDNEDPEREYLSGVQSILENDQRLLESERNLQRELRFREFDNPADRELFIQERREEMRLQKLQRDGRVIEVMRGIAEKYNQRLTEQQKNDLIANTGILLLAGLAGLFQNSERYGRSVRGDNNIVDNSLPILAELNNSYDITVQTNRVNDELQLLGEINQKRIQILRKQQQIRELESQEELSDEDTTNLENYRRELQRLERELGRLERELERFRENDRLTLQRIRRRRSRSNVRRAARARINQERREFARFFRSHNINLDDLTNWSERILAGEELDFIEGEFLPHRFIEFLEGNAIEGEDPFTVSDRWLRFLNFLERSGDLEDVGDLRNAINRIIRAARNHITSDQSAIPWQEADSVVASSLRAGIALETRRAEPLRERFRELIEQDGNNYNEQIQEVLLPLMEIFTRISDLERRAGIRERRGRGEVEDTPQLPISEEFNDILTEARQASPGVTRDAILLVGNIFDNWRTQLNDREDHPGFTLSDLRREIDEAELSPEIEREALNIGIQAITGRYPEDVLNLFRFFEILDQDMESEIALPEFRDFRSLSSRFQTRLLGGLLEGFGTDGNLEGILFALFPNREDSTFANLLDNLRTSALSLSITGGVLVAVPEEAQFNEIIWNDQQVQTVSEAFIQAQREMNEIRGDRDILSVLNPNVIAGIGWNEADGFQAELTAQIELNLEENGVLNQTASRRYLDSIHRFKTTLVRRAAEIQNAYIDLYYAERNYLEQRQALQIYEETMSQDDFVSMIARLEARGDLGRREVVEAQRRLARALNQEEDISYTTILENGTQQNLEGIINNIRARIERISLLSIQNMPPEVRSVISPSGVREFLSRFRVRAGVSLSTPSASDDSVTSFWSFPISAYISATYEIYNSRSTVERELIETLRAEYLRDLRERLGGVITNRRERVELVFDSNHITRLRGTEEALIFALMRNQIEPSSDFMSLYSEIRTHVRDRDFREPNNETYRSLLRAYFESINSALQNGTIDYSIYRELRRNGFAQLEDREEVLEEIEHIQIQNQTLSDEINIITDQIRALEQELEGINFDELRSAQEEEAEQREELIENQIDLLEEESEAFSDDVQEDLLERHQSIDLEQIDENLRQFHSRMRPILYLLEQDGALSWSDRRKLQRALDRHNEMRQLLDVITIRENIARVRTQIDHFVIQGEMRIPSLDNFLRLDEEEKTSMITALRNELRRLEIRRDTIREISRIRSDFLELVQSVRRMSDRPQNLTAYLNSFRTPSVGDDSIIESRVMFYLRDRDLISIPLGSERDVLSAIQNMERRIRELRDGVEDEQEEEVNPRA